MGYHIKTLMLHLAALGRWTAGTGPALQLPLRADPCGQHSSRPRSPGDQLYSFNFLGSSTIV